MTPRSPSEFVARITRLGTALGIVKRATVLGFGVPQISAVVRAELLATFYELGASPAAMVADGKRGAAEAYAEWERMRDALP